MRQLWLVAAVMAAFPAVAVFPAAAEPLADPQRARAAAVQADQQRRIEQAREKCLAHRGADCDTHAGLHEWMLQDRTREQAVLDRIGGEGASAGSSSAPVRPDIPAVTPRQQ
jgi:hypothetical protein